jgi:hypothetical protein
VVLFVRRPSVNISHFNLLLRNHWTNCDQTLVEWSLDGPLSKVCPVIPTSNQDGHQAENSYMARSSLTYIPGFIFSNSGHLEWRAGLSDTILKGTHPGTIPARLGLIWFSSFRGKDLNVIVYQNMPNLHNRYKKNELKFNCSYMTMSRLTYILGFSVNFFFQPIYTDYAN